MKPKNPPIDDLYAHLTPVLRSLAMRGVVRSYPKKSILINEGDQGDSIFVLLKGSVKVFSMDTSGREIVYGKIQAAYGQFCAADGGKSPDIVAGGLIF